MQNWLAKKEAATAEGDQKPAAVEGGAAASGEQAGAPATSKCPYSGPKSKCSKGIQTCTKCKRDAQKEAEEIAEREGAAQA
jgi:hypothetical protein